MELNKHQRSVIHGTQQNSNSLKPPTLFLPANGEAGVLFWTSCSVSFSPLTVCVQDIAVLLFLKDY